MCMLFPGCFFNDSGPDGSVWPAVLFGKSLQFFGGGYNEKRSAAKDDSQQTAAELI